MKIDLHDLIIRNEEPLSSEIDGERVMMSLDQGKYFGLNTVGSYIWELIEKKPSFEALLKEIEKKYEVDSEVCKNETQLFLEQLVEKKLITIEKP